MLNDEGLVEVESEVEDEVETDAIAEAAKFPWSKEMADSFLDDWSSQKQVEG